LVQGGVGYESRGADVPDAQEHRAALRHPQHRRELRGDHDALADWSRELANLLAGSLKTALLRQGIIIELGLPASLLGSEVRIALPAATSLGLLFIAGANHLHIGLAAYLADDVALRLDEESGAPFDVLLF